MNKTIATTALALAIGLAGASSAAADAPGYNKHKPAPHQPVWRGPVKRAPVVKQPVVTAVPKQAVTGQTIIIRGQHFSRAMKLRLGATTIAPRYVSRTQLRFAIPARMVAKRYPMFLVGPRQKHKRIGTLALYRPRPLPIVRFAVTSAPKVAVLGQTITIRGHRLSRNMTLRIGNKTIAPRYASARMLQFVVPRSLASRRYNMQLVGPYQSERIGVIALRPAPRPAWRLGWTFKAGMFFHLNG